jgi:hypothetical protein
MTDPTGGERARRFFGVGAGTYASGQWELQPAVPDGWNFATLFHPIFDGDPVEDPKKERTSAHASTR